MKNVAAIGFFAIVFGFLAIPAAPARAAKTPTPSPVPSVTPAEHPKEKKRSFIDRMNPFAKREKAAPSPAAAAASSPTAVPKPEAEPKAWPSGRHKRHAAPEEEEASPTPRPRRKAKPTPEETPAAEPTSTPTATPRAEATGTPLPTRSQKTPEPSASISQAVSPQQTAAPTEAATADTPQMQATPIATPGIDDEAIAEARYQTAKTKALQDPAIISLQDKADMAKDQDTQRSLTKAYYRALFDKMRKLDPSIKPRVDRMETATIKRLQTMGAE